MSKNTIPVSVIVPNYNSGHYLEECIVSINSGQWPVEILIIDDCSTDESLHLAIKLQSQYSNIRVIQREKNGGAAEARKSGFAAAKYDWVALVDADDVLEENAVANAYIKAIEECSDICIWDMWRFDSDRSWCNISLKITDFPKTGRQAVIDTLGAWRIHPLGVAKKNLYLSAYCGFEETAQNSDELITRLIFASACKVSFCEKKYFYRVNLQSSTQKISIKNLTTLHSYIWLLKFAKNYPEVQLEKIASGAVAHAWGFFKNRKLYGDELVISTLSDFIPKLIKHSELFKWLWRYPKHTFAFFVIWIAIKLKTSR